MSRKPAFLFVPAAWHLPAYFGPLITYLSDYGYISVAVTLPSVNSSPAVTSLQPDVNTVAAALTTLLDNDSDVIVVMHSYGGMVGTDAVGKAVKELADAGGIYGKDSAKVKRLVYVAARVPLEGDTILSMLDGVLVEGPPPPRDHWTFEEPYVLLKKKAADVLYHDVPEPLFSQYASLLGKQPAATFSSPVVYAGWRDVPSTYIYATQDRQMPLAYQKFMVKRAQETARQDGSVMPFEGEIGELYLDSGHTPFLSVTQKLGEVLIRAAEV